MHNSWQHTASVTFNFDTTNYTGTLSLVDGETAWLSGSWVVEPSPLHIAAGFEYPGAPPPPPGVDGDIDTLIGTFTLVNGQITAWSMTGTDMIVNCEIGPACTGGCTQLRHLRRWKVCPRSLLSAWKIS